MIVTEEQARKLRCCGPVNPGEADDYVMGGLHCIASQCMAWRWFDQRYDYGDKQMNADMARQRRGYCGLARQPSL